MCSLKEFHGDSQTENDKVKQMVVLKKEETDFNEDRYSHMVGNTILPDDQGQTMVETISDRAQALVYPVEHHLDTHRLSNKRTNECPKSGQKTRHNNCQANTETFAGSLWMNSLKTNDGKQTYFPDETPQQRGNLKSVNVYNIVGADMEQTKTSISVHPPHFIPMKTLHTSLRNGDDCLGSPLDTELENDSINNLEDVFSKTMHTDDKKYFEGIEHVLKCQQLIPGVSPSNPDKCSVARMKKLEDCMFANVKIPDSQSEGHCIIIDSDQQALPTERNQSEDTCITIPVISVCQANTASDNGVLSTADTSRGEDAMSVALGMIKILNTTPSCESCCAAIRQSAPDETSLIRLKDVSGNSIIPHPPTSCELLPNETSIRTVSVSDCNNPTLCCHNLNMVIEKDTMSFDNVESFACDKSNTAITATQSNVTSDLRSDERAYSRRRLKKATALTETCKTKHDIQVFSLSDTAVTDKVNHAGQFITVSSKAELADNTQEPLSHHLLEGSSEENLQLMWHLAMTGIENASTPNPDYGQGEGGSLQDDYVVVDDTYSLQNHETDGVHHGGTDMEQLNELLRSFDQRQTKASSEICEWPRDGTGPVERSFNSSTFESIAISSYSCQEDTPTLHNNIPTTGQEYKSENSWLECTVANMQNNLIQDDTLSVIYNQSNDSHIEHICSELDYIEIEAVRHTSRVSSVTNGSQQNIETESSGISNQNSDHEKPDWGFEIYNDGQNVPEIVFQCKDLPHIHIGSYTNVPQDNHSKRECFKNDKCLNLYDAVAEYQHITSNVLEKESVTPNTDRMSTKKDLSKEFQCMIRRISEIENSLEIHNGSSKKELQNKPVTGEFCDVDNNADILDYEFFEMPPKYQELP